MWFFRYIEVIGYAIFAIILLSLGMCSHNKPSVPSPSKPPREIHYTSGPLAGCVEYHPDILDYKDKVIRCPASETVTTTEHQQYLMGKNVVHENKRSVTITDVKK